MKCSTCRIESNDLRAYQPLAPIGAPHEEVRLCPACRVQNSLHPRYAPVPESALSQSAPIAPTAGVRARAGLLAMHPH